MASPVIEARYVNGIPVLWEHFAQSYALHGSTKRAAGEVGMALSHAKQLVFDERVIRRIRQIQEAQFRAVGITAERVKAELARVAFASAADLYDESGNMIPIHLLPDDVAATITGIEVEVQKVLPRKPMKEGGAIDWEAAERESESEAVVTKKFRRADKMAALALLARHFKLVGAEDDGVNQLATALADRLNAAKRRLGEPPPAEVVDIEPTERRPDVIDSTPDLAEAAIIDSAPPAAAADDDELWR